MALKEVIYTTESKIKKPKKLIKEMLQDLKNSWQLGWSIFIKEVKGDYAQSVLGMFWDFLQPLIICIIFIFLFQSQILKFGSLDMPYPVFIVHGMMLWQTFMESLNMSLKMLEHSKAMVTHLQVPKESFIIATVYRVSFNSIFRIAVIFICNLYFNIISWHSLLLILAYPAIIILGLSMGLFLVPLGILYNDVQKAVAIFLNVMFYASPVIYPLPRAYPFDLLLYINPMAIIINGVRDISVLGTIYNPISFSIVIVLSLILLLIAWINYYVTMPILVERM